jgi:class 3 adenylate cyclase
MGPSHQRQQSLSSTPLRQCFVSNKSAWQFVEAIHRLIKRLFAWIVADIAGFTAWSSMRDPHQVFTLLESIFQAFDVLAKKRGVYKVETIGDCYVGELLRKDIDKSAS